MPRQRGLSRQMRRSSSAVGSVRGRLVMVLSLMGSDLHYGSASVEELVRGQRQELIEGLGLDHLLEEARGGRKHALGEPRSAYFAVDAVELGVQQPIEARHGHGSAVA